MNKGNPNFGKEQLRIKAENGPSRYTVADDWQVRRDDANINWMVYNKREVKNPRSGAYERKWVHTGTYHRLFGDALMHIYSKMAGRGVDKRNIRQTAKHFDNLYIGIKSCLPMTPEEEMAEKILEEKHLFQKKIRGMEIKQLREELKKRESDEMS